MSIILKGIGLPKDNKILKLEIYDDGSIYEDKGAEWQGYPQGTAIQIPKGARLIDANAIDYDEFWCRDGQGFSIAVCQGAERIISEQPTILESEEE